VTADTSRPEAPAESPSLLIPKNAPQKTLEVFDIVSKFCIGLGSLVLSAAIGFSTIYFTHRATERQASVQVETLVLQRRSSAAQVELSLLPVFTHGTDTERQWALSILASLAPDEAERVGTVIIPQLKSEMQRREVFQVISTVPERKRQQEFRQRLQNAAVYRQFSLDANACREYFAAFDSLSAAEKKEVAAQREMARREYSQGQFSNAAARLQSVLGTK
jgi:hypothetical protein